MEQHNVGSLVQTLSLRAVVSDLHRHPASAGEREHLQALPKPIAAAGAQDYLAWRRAVLWGAALVLGVAAVLQIVDYTSVETALDGLLAQSGMTARQVFGDSSMTNLEAVSILPLLAALTGTGMSVFAAIKWDQPALSRKAARFGWVVLIGTPLVLALVPWSTLIETPGLPDLAQATQVRQALGLLLGLHFFLTLGPKVISLFAGVTRSALTVKTLLPEASTPGWAVSICAPLYAVFLVVVVTTINQMQGGFLLSAGIAAMIVAQGTYLNQAQKLMAPTDPAGASDLVRRTRLHALAFNGAGILCIGIHLIRNDIGVIATIQFLVSGIGGLLLMMVVFGDLTVSLIQSGFRQSTSFHGTDSATSLGDRLGQLDAAGIVQHNASFLPAEVPAPAGPSGSDPQRGPDGPPSPE